MLRSTVGRLSEPKISADLELEFKVLVRFDYVPCMYFVRIYNEYYRKSANQHWWFSQFVVASGGITCYNLDHHDEN